MRNKKEVNISQDILNEAEVIMGQFKFFVDGYRVLFLIHRSKEESVSANNDKVRKIISKNKDEFKTALISLLQDFYNTDNILRIYSCVNARDINKAIRQFKQEQLDADYYDIESKNSFYIDVKNRFIGALMKPASRTETQFILDCDSMKEQEDALKKVAELEIEVIKMYPTKNGWHIITKPFNPNLFLVENVGINKDGLILLKY